MSDVVGEFSGRLTDTTNVHEALEQNILKRTCLGGQEYYECLVCKRTMAGFVPAEAHLQGSPHSKALRNNAFSHVTGALSKLQLDKEGSETHCAFDSLDNGSCLDVGSGDDMLKRAIDDGMVTRNSAAGILTLVCELCNVSCTGDPCMVQHLDGEPHKKRQRRKGILSTSNMGTESRQPLTSRLSTGYSTGSSGVGNVPLLNINPQLTGAVGEESLQKAFSEGIIVRESSSVGDVLTCTVCCKSCTGIVPMKQHLSSAAHIKKLGSRGMAAGGNFKSENALSQPGSTISQLQRNYDSPSVQGRNSRYLDSRDEVEMVPSIRESPATSKHENQDPLDEAENLVMEMDGMLVCILCQLQCTGRANMIEHLQGDHHRRKWRDQVDQLKMLSTSATSRSIQSLPVLRPASLAVSQDNRTSSQKVPSNSVVSQTSILNPPPATRVLNPPLTDFGRSCHIGSIRRAMNLPQNLSDLDVYFPDEPLGNKF